MFGLLRPNDAALGCGLRQEFNRFYCGLCKGLDHHHGAVTRGLLSYDGVFVALLVDALVPEADIAAPSSCRCPVLPVVHRKTVAPDSVAMTYAASVQMLLFDQWAADGKRSLVRRFSRPHADRAHARLDALGISLRALEGFERVQEEVEQRDATPAEAAAPTANALARVFGNIAHLRADAPALEEPLRELGAAIGRAIYFVDALEDLEDDVRKGAFNPCIVHGTRNEERVRETARLLRADAGTAGARLSALPLERHQRVLRNIVGALADRAARAMERVRRDAPRPTGLGALVAMSGRLRTVAVAIAAVLWALLCAIPKALAAGPKDAGHDAAAKDAGTDAAAAPNLPNMSYNDRDAGPESAPPPPAPSTKTGGEKEKGDGGGSGSGGSCPSCQDCKDCCDAPGKCCDGCTNCCNNCGDCTKGCDGCGKCCGDCSRCCGK